MLPNEFCHPAKLGRLEASAACQVDGIEPELCDPIILLDVDMGRLRAVARVEEEPVRTNPQNRRHGLRTRRLASRTLGSEGGGGGQWSATPSPRQLALGSELAWRVRLRRLKRFVE
jgi:hypothetical protein